MDKDNLYLNILAETFADRSTNSSDEEKQKVFHFKSFIQIMTTLREIIEKQDEISHQIEELQKEQELIKTEVDKIQILNNQVKKLNDSFALIYSNKKSWGKVKIWLSAFIAAIGSVLAGIAWLNQMGVFSIVWNVKK
jgi:hypothetical protein